ncbi:hypothetical protein Pssp01_25760 [Pseudomonas sp. NBRC 100443]|nr:hypothetical protein Pssp01_25760 [Pseudomonas sp. NBRC 100443]
MARIGWWSSGSSRVRRWKPTLSVSAPAASEKISSTTQQTNRPNMVLSTPNAASGTGVAGRLGAAGRRGADILAGYAPISRRAGRRIDGGRGCCGEGRGRGCRRGIPCGWHQTITPWLRR